MQKSNGEGPNPRLFDFATTKCEMAVARAAPHPIADPSVRWDRCQASRSAPLRVPPYRRAGKRAFDLVLVLASLPFTLPLIALCALALWIESGPPFYTQRRIGLHGRRFSILKLRTMVRDADAVLARLLAEDPGARAQWDSLQKLLNDPRVTRVGGFLRATSLDELPQLLNVLRGDMSLVGPRPMMTEQEQMYGDMRAYVALRPGITGLWQVSARNANTFCYRNEMDEAYEQSLSLRNDVSILVKAFGVVLRGTGC